MKYRALGLVAAFLFAFSFSPAAFGADAAPQNGVKSRPADRRDLRRLQKDLKLIAESLADQVDVEEEAEQSLDFLSKEGLDRQERLAQSGNIDPQLAPALARLNKLFVSLPQKKYAEPYGAELVRALAHEIRWIADKAKTKKQLLKMLDERLVLPESIETQDFLKTDVPVDEFVAQGPLRVFAAKHRLHQPASYLPTTAQDIVSGKHNVQIGVEITAVVTRHYAKFSIDGDYTFDVGDLHIEITPEWADAHPDMHLPEGGQRVKVRGWTYYDIFHDEEAEYDPADPILGINRVTVWEIHPVMSVELLPPDTP